MLFSLTINKKALNNPNSLDIEVWKVLVIVSGMSLLAICVWHAGTAERLITSAVIECYKVLQSTINIKNEPCNTHLTSLARQFNQMLGQSIPYISPDFITKNFVVPPVKSEGKWQMSEKGSRKVQAKWSQSLWAHILR